MQNIIGSVAVIFSLALFGCGDDDNPVDPDAGDQAHVDDAVGLVVRNSGEVIARYENGEVSGAIEVGAGKETPLLQVHFLAEDGDLFTPDENAGFALDWEIADEAVAKVEWHDEDGAWNFHIVGVSLGQTTIRIKINHNDHADFVSKEIEIHVEEDGPGEAHDDHADDHADEDDDHADEGE